jgi:hypothetical protein
MSAASRMPSGIAIQASIITGLNSDFGEQAVNVMLNAITQVNALSFIKWIVSGSKLQDPAMLHNAVSTSKGLSRA